MKRRHALASATLIAALAVSTACSSGSGSSGGGSSSSSGAAAPTSFQEEHKGGTLHLVAKSAGGTIDPMINYTLQYWQLYQAMYDGLLAFKKVGGEESFTVVPDLAEDMPEVSEDG